MSAAINVTRKGQDFSVDGAWVEYGSFDMQPNNIIAQSASQEVAGITEAQVGDLVFINGESLTAMAILQGAKVTAAGTVTLYFSNAYYQQTLIFPATIHFDYIIVHFAAV